VSVCVAPLSAGETPAQYLNACLALDAVAGSDGADAVVLLENDVYVARTRSATSRSAAAPSRAGGGSGGMDEVNTLMAADLASLFGEASGRPFSAAEFARATCPLRTARLCRLAASGTSATDRDS
jgi:hypothetical protein